MRKSTPRKYTFEAIQKEALKYKSRGEFQRLSLGHYRAAYDRGFLEQICAHMPKHVSMAGENSPVFKWTDRLLQKEALKYKTRTEFIKGNRSAYFTAQSRDLLDQICSHMTRLIRKDWTIEELHQEALKYKTRGEFSKNGKKAYSAARRKKILDQICYHMGKPCGTSIPEKSIFEIIKSLYPKVQKLRDSKIKVENKPHIQGFDLDIYVPELRKAIEFDGKYHHSFEGLKRARSWWPDEDIKNYHNLKDNHFKNKGIQILHIKEEDWIENKQKCIDKCLDFLGVMVI